MLAGHASKSKRHFRTTRKVKTCSMLMRMSSRKETNSGAEEEKIVGGVGKRIGSSVQWKSRLWVGLGDLKFQSGQ